jgi:transcriptional regulator with XRE-family HTH domain
MTASAYAKIEEGVTQITVERLQAIAKALKTSIYKFLGEDGTIISHLENNNFTECQNIGVIQNSFENERKALQAHIADLKQAHASEISRLDKIVEKLMGK